MDHYNQKSNTAENILAKVYHVSDKETLKYSKLMRQMKN